MHGLVRAGTASGSEVHADDGTVLASFSMPVDHALVQGHYPGRPIVPGTCLLEAAFQAIEQAEGLSTDTLRLCQIDDLQLVHPVCPGERVELKLCPVAGADAAPPMRRRWRVSMSSAGLQVARASLHVGVSADRQPCDVPQWTVTPAWTALAPLDVARRLPHRAPLLLVDAAWLAPGGERLVATRSVTLGDVCYAGLSPCPQAGEIHYPVLMAAESFAQAAGLLLGGVATSQAAPPLMLLGGARRLEFHGAAYLGERLRHELQLRRSFGSTALVGGETFADERLIARTHDLLITVKTSQTPAPAEPIAAASALSRATVPHPSPLGALRHAS